MKRNDDNLLSQDMRGKRQEARGKRQEVRLLNEVYLLLGTNLGERERNLRLARQKIQGKMGEILRQSAIYETSAWGKTDQPTFLNQVICVTTSLLPLEVLEFTQATERELGRVKIEHWGERMIDIDILYYSDKIIKLENLTIPHQFLQERRFTLVPLAEIAPHIVHPILLKTNEELLSNCVDIGEVKMLSQS